MKRYIEFVILGILMLLLGCAEDKGNYDYTPVNELTISGIPKDTSVVHLEVLKIKPVFTCSLSASEDHLEYSWKIAGKEIATTRDLEYEVSPEWQIKKHDCLYTVTDTETGMKYFHEFNISVSSSFSWGYYFLCEESDGSTVLSYFSVKEGTRNCLHTKQCGDYIFGKHPKAMIDKFGYINSLEDYYYTMYIITSEGENPVIVTDNGAFMPTSLINNSSLIYEGEDFKPMEGIGMLTGDICFLSNGKLMSYSSGLLYRPGKHDKKYNWTHIASSYSYIYAFDELTKKFYILKNQINDPEAGLVMDRYAYDRVVEIQDQPSYEGQSIIQQMVNRSHVMYLATAGNNQVNLMKFEYIDSQKATETLPALNEYGHVQEINTLPLPDAGEKTKGVLVAENDWYFVVGNKVYTSPVLLPKISDFVTLPDGLGEVTAVGISSKETQLIIATYDENSANENKGSFVIIDLMSKQMTIHKNVMSKCVVVKGYDANPWF